jgi:hypothetical protein
MIIMIIVVGGGIAKGGGVATYTSGWIEYKR